MRLEPDSQLVALEEGKMTLGHVPESLLQLIAMLQHDGLATTTK
jgi:hypothetical protein